MRKYILVFFILVLAAELLAVFLEDQALQFVFKPLLIPVLIAYVIASLPRGKADPWILLALLFSWAGDVLLMFQPSNSSFFLYGLIAFLLAHICYIIFFARLRLLENIRINPWLSLPVLTYYLVLMLFLSPGLYEMKWPVSIYGFVISVMLVLAIHLGFIKNRVAGYRIVAGATLFIISDSILAFDSFYARFDYAGLLIMLTYGLAQLFLVLGATYYLNPPKSL